jgi:hypothetical protein
MDKERLFRYLERKYSSKSEIIPNIPLGEDADAIWAGQVWRAGSVPAHISRTTKQSALT